MIPEIAEAPRTIASQMQDDALHHCDSAVQRPHAEDAQRAPLLWSTRGQADWLYSSWPAAQTAAPQKLRQQLLGLVLQAALQGVDQNGNLQKVS